MRHWAFDSIFYHIYPLGFCDALFRNNFSSTPVNRLEKIYGWVEHMKSMGINALYLGPVFESTYHGYDTADYYTVDRRLGTNQTLKELASVLTQNGIRIILDGVFNHVGRDFWAFRDVMNNRQNSRYCSWFEGLDFSGNNHYNDNFTYQGWNGHYDLVKLNLKNPEVKKHLFNAVKMWIEEFNISGLRLDAADCVDMNFLEELSLFVKNQRSDFWLMGEIIHGDYNKWVNPKTLDSVTNYECYKGLYSSHNDKNYFEIAYALKRQYGENGIYKNKPLYSFADNHDVNRIASTLKNSAHLYPLHCLLFTMPGVPSIYYGSEWGVEGRKTNGSDNALRPSIELHMSGKYNHKELKHFIDKLSRIRSSSNSLKYGNYKELHVSREQMAFMRETENEKILVILNSSDNGVKLDIKVPVSDGMVFHDVINDNCCYTVTNSTLKIDNVWPNWVSILKHSQ